MRLRQRKKGGLLNQSPITKLRKSMARHKEAFGFQSKFASKIIPINHAEKERPLIVAYLAANTSNSNACR